MRYFQLGKISIPQEVAEMYTRAVLNTHERNNRSERQLGQHQQITSGRTRHRCTFYLTEESPSRKLLSWRVSCPLDAEPEDRLTLLLIAAMMVCLGHGSNDVANSIAPFLEVL